jgi:glycosyltransferase involved in cell wall biosynthesis
VPDTLLFYFPTTERFTGGPRSVLNLMRGVDRARCRPVFVTQMESPLLLAARAEGIETRVLPFPPVLNPPRRELLGAPIGRQLRALAAVARYNLRAEACIRQTGARAVWVRGVEAALLVGSGTRRLGLPLVLDLGAEPVPGGVLRVAYWYAAALASRIVAQDTRQVPLVFGSRAARLLRPRVHVLSPGIPPERVAAAARVPRRTPGRFTVLCPATLHPRKNQLMLLRAVAALAPRHGQLCVRLAGAVADAAYETRLRTFARDHLAPGVVEFLGWRDDLPELMRDSDVVVLCSRVEGIPHALREAMHVGVPVVATAVGGIPDLVRDGETGLLVDDEDTPRLTAALERCMAQPALLQALAQRALHHVTEHYSFAAWLDAYNRILRDLPSPR